MARGTARPRKAQRKALACCTRSGQAATTWAAARDPARSPSTSNGKASKASGAGRVSAPSSAAGGSGAALSAARAARVVGGRVCCMVSTSTERAGGAGSAGAGVCSAPARKARPPLLRAERRTDRVRGLGAAVRRRPGQHVEQIGQGQQNPAALAQPSNEPLE